MRWRCLLLAGMLGGCTLLPTAPAVRPAQPDSASFKLNGRISVKYNGSHHSAGLRWTHTAQSDEILLLAPLGQTAARIYRDASGAMLDDGEQRHEAASTEILMQQVLGWYLPLGGLHHWVLGLPEAGSPAQVERNGNGQIALLRQDGWEIRYLRHSATQQDSLPTRLHMSRNDLQLQLLIDEWELP